MEQVNYCLKCGERIDRNNRFCSHCGAAIERPEIPGLKEELKAKSGGSLLKHVRWSWMFVTVGIVMMLMYLNMIVLKAIYNGGKDEVGLIPLDVAVWSALLIIFLGSFITALLSPGKTIREPALGCTFIVIFSSLLQGNADSLFFGWIIPYFLGLGGAWLGERLSKKTMGIKNDLQVPEKHEIVEVLH